MVQKCSRSNNAALVELPNSFLKLIFEGVKKVTHSVTHYYLLRHTVSQEQTGEACIAFQC